MKKVVAKSLEEAIIKASSELGCSVNALEYEVVQNPSGGFLGLGKKDAIIVVDTKGLEHIEAKYPNLESTYKEKEHVSRDIGYTEVYKETSFKKYADGMDYQEDVNIYSQEVWGVQSMQNQDHEANVAQIKTEIESLFALLPFEIDHFDVRLDTTDNTLFVCLNGRDCALLIGEKGYRYKALSYLLFNWINPKYGYLLRLEIAEFLKNQEEMIDVYLKDIVANVNISGKAQTKTLDGILVYIALNKLREIFPNKYVSIRQNEADEKYIIIDDFR